MMKASKKALSAILFVILGLFIVGYFIHIAFDESRYFSKNSLDYYLLVHSRYVKNFPLPENVIKVTYHSSCGDGPKPPSTAVQIDTTALGEDYINAVKNFVTKNNLKKTQNEGVFRLATVYKDINNDEIEIVIGKVENGLYSIILEHRTY
jgi:hypothetical protein